MAKEANKSGKDKKAKNEKKDSKNFFKEFKAELKRVSWPTFKQVVNNTLAVIAIVVLIAVIVFILDVIFENANKFGVEKLKAIVTSNSSEEAGEGEENTSNEAEVVDAENSEAAVETENAEESSETTSEEVTENVNSADGTVDSSEEQTPATEGQNPADASGAGTEVSATSEN